MTGLDGIVSRYGQSVTVRYGDGRPELAVRAIFQPVVERREDWRQEMPTPLGLIRRDRFLYIGTPEAPVAAGVELLWRGQVFRVQSAQAIYVGEKQSHWWAVAVPEDEE